MILKWKILYIVWKRILENVMWKLGYCFFDLRYVTFVLRFKASSKTVQTYEGYEIRHRKSFEY